MMKFWITLIICLQSNCAHAQAAADEKGEVIAPYFAHIDPKNPPTAGIWSNYENAHKFAYALRAKELKLKLDVVETEKQRDLLLAQLEQSNAVVASIQDKQGIWQKLQFPLAMIGGFALGMGATVLIYQMVH